MSDSVVLACEGLVKEFRQGPALVRVLQGVDTTIRQGERVAVVGASGSGKTTLLQLLGGLDLPTAGRVLIDGREMSALEDAERGLLRNAAMGFVYQFHHLLPEFSALENVAMPLLIRRMARAEAAREASALLARVGLGSVSGTARRSFPEASGSVPQSHGRSSRGRASCSRTSRRAIWTVVTQSRSSIS
jgi:lipoprotein-releasing system ATP-binding protein